ncbi:MAG: DnaB-like helicase N-terminal domain-containing protein [Pseudomonadota bacterium]
MRGRFILAPPVCPCPDCANGAIALHPRYALALPEGCVVAPSQLSAQGGAGVTASAVARVAPHNDEAEMALLGALLHSHGRALDRVAEFLEPAHFASRVHGRIYRAIQLLVDRNQVADPITLKQYFEADGDLAEIGGYEYLMQLAGATASIRHAADYGRRSATWRCAAS